ncbi:uncharacterized protein TNCV_955981 [Trichonephila clavipes]|nr:uncharacterized protein TNCV_955981 [Trichonephila clavipes]
MLLQRFKLTAEKFRDLFSRHRESPNGTWKDYYFEYRAYFEGWLNELKIDSFDGLKNLMIADQMKKRCSPECKEHYLDIWEELISPEMLADKLEAFDNIRRSLPSGPRRHVPNERSPLRCYGCGKQGVIKSSCPICNLNASQRTDVTPNHINAYTVQTRSPRLTLIDITFCGIKGRETTLAMSLADGQQTTDEALTTQKEKLNLLLESFQNVFEPGGEATNILEHHINTGNSPPISVPPYRMSPIKNCPDCIKYKASNQKPSGLLQTPVPAQRFETLAIDIFGSLPESKDGKRWILIIEDCTTKWVKLFALPNSTAKECAITMIEEVLLRYTMEPSLCQQ